ncbi:MAG: type II secretion system F family protein [Pseudomonadota bacterium]
MKVFQYKAMDATGRIRRGRLVAANLDELEASIGGMGLDLVTCKTVTSRTLRLYRKNINRRDLIDFCFQLEQLLTAGVVLLTGLEDLRNSSENPRFKEIISALIDRINDGKTFSSALEEFPRIFNPVFVNLVRVGEQSGELPAILRNIGENMRWDDEIAARASKALMYPSFVALIVSSVVAFLMIYLVPQLVQFITSMEGTLPIHTRALLFTSNIFTHYWYLLLGIPLALWAGLAVAMRLNPEVRLRVDAAKLRFWLLGEIFQKIILARFARVFSLMYRAGIPVLQILDISMHVTGNLAISRALNDSRRQVTEGVSLSVAFTGTSMFPPFVVRMINVGENTGDLESAMRNVSYFYERDVKERIDKVEAALEPLITVVLGAVLGWIILSVLGPVYDLVSKIKV